MQRPGCCLRPHTGPSNTRLRLHLGVCVPEPEHCLVECGGLVRRWQEGRVLLIDDSYLHLTRNASRAAARVVLIVDLLRPCVGIGALSRMACADRYRSWSGGDNLANATAARAQLLGQIRSADGAGKHDV